MVDAGRHDLERRAPARHVDGWMLHCVRMLAAAFFLVVSIGISALPANAATKVGTALSEQGGYGRIVFTWPGGVPRHTQSMVAGVLVVKFDAPFSIDLNEFLRQMPNTVGLARQDADGKTLRLGLKFEYWMNVREAENSLYVDLLPSTWAGAPPPLPADVLARLAAAAEAKAKAAAEAKLAKEMGVIDPTAPPPALVVRVGRHDGITRLVFDWNQPVLYSIAQQEGSATITFDRSAKVALAPIRVDPPPYLQTISARERDGRLSIFMKLKSGVTVSDFREDLGVVLDLKPAQAALTEVVEPEKAAATAPKAEEPVAPPKETAAAQPPSEHTPKSITPPAAEQAQVAPEPVQAAEKTPVAPQVAPETKVAEAVGAPLKVEAQNANGRLDLLFPWREATGAAVFVRSNTLWIVFDHQAPLDLTAIDPAVLKEIGAPTVVDVEKGTALAIPLKGARLLAGAAEDGTAWRISLADTLTSTGRSISLTRSWSESGEGVVSLDLSGARDILKIRDPLVRDTLMVATARGTIQSVQASRSFVEFQALQTTQGVAIVRIADDLNVAAAPDAVVISRHDGLTLSADNDGTPTSLVRGVAARSPAATDFPAWRGSGRFIVNRQEHLKNILAATADEQAAARVAYARFLLANGIGPEALTQLDMASNEEKKLENDPAFRALRGIGEVMADRHAQAISDLSTSSLEMDPNAAVWRGLARASLGQMDAALKDFNFGNTAIDALDPALAQKVHLKAAEAALAMKDVASARGYLAHLPAVIADRGTRAQSLVLQAELLGALDKPAEAVALYDKAIAEGDRGATVRARFEKAVLLNKTGKLSNDKLIDELNRLRMAWRGDDLERRILSKLAELQLAKGNVVEALGAMRVATINFPDSDDARAMGAQMPDIFADYFIGPGAKNLTAVQALAFYYNFQDLTPIGQKGDELIRHLAERLVSIDLLAQAEVLLRYQVEQRLYGSVAKAQVAARLAGVYLLDEKPNEALQIIRATAQNQLPEELGRQRQLIEARALASLKQYDLSLDLLSEMTGEQAERLRADVMWEAQRWDEAGQAAQALAEKGNISAKPDKELPANVRFDVMRAAIAYSFATDEEGLSRLRATFGDRMAHTPDASAFAVVSDPIERSGVAFRELASRIAAVNMIERFVSTLKTDDAPPAAPAKAANANVASPVAVN